jgi:nucleoside-diphosphate-sugar epimerase
MRRGGKILIIGGAGYIGSILAGELLRKGYLVRVLDNFIFGNYSLSKLLDNGKLQLIKGDVRHIEDLVIAMKGMDTVVNLAALVGDKMCSLDRDSAITVNYEATKMVMEICKFCNIERFLFTSTCSVYGKAANLLCTEDSLLSPVSLYAETKARAEDIVLKQGCIITTVFRLATVFGFSFRMRFDLVVNTLVAHAINEGRIKIFGGNQWRPLIHNLDVAKALILCIEAEKSKVDHQIFNLGSENLNLRISQLGQIIKKCIPQIIVEHMQSVEDERDYKVSFAKIANVLGFISEKTIEDAVFEIKSLFDKGIVKDYKDPSYYNVEYRY